MPTKLINCMSLPPATRSSVPIYEYWKANQELSNRDTEEYYSCCGKSICKGCLFGKIGNDDRCPFCNSNRGRIINDTMKRAAANDVNAICLLASHYHHGRAGFQQNQTKAIELFTKSAELGFSKAHFFLGCILEAGGDLKKVKFHLEAAAMAGHEMARLNIGNLEAKSGNMDRAVKHWNIAASTGDFLPCNN